MADKASRDSSAVVAPNEYEDIERELDAPYVDEEALAEANRQRRCKYLPELTEHQARVVIVLLAITLGITLIAGLLYERPVNIGLSPSGLDNVNVTMNTTDGTILMRGELDAVVTNHNFVSLSATNIDVTLTKLDASVKVVQPGPVRLPIRGTVAIPLEFNGLLRAEDTAAALAAISNECFYGQVTFDVNGTVDIHHPLASGTYSFAFSDQVIEC